MAKGSKTSIRARGGEITHHQHETDSPILPIDNIERLHQLRPDRVDWIFDQTETEANHRRTEQKRLHRFIFIENICGQIFTFLTVIAVIGFAVWAMVNGHPLTGGVAIGATTIAFAVIRIAFAVTQAMSTRK